VNRFTSVDVDLAHVLPRFCAPPAGSQKYTSDSTPGIEPRSRRLSPSSSRHFPVRRWGQNRHAPRVAFRSEQAEAGIGNHLLFDQERQRDQRENSAGRARSPTRLHAKVPSVCTSWPLPFFLGGAVRACKDTASSPAPSPSAQVSGFGFRYQPVPAIALVLPADAGRNAKEGGRT